MPVPIEQPQPQLHSEWVYVTPAIAKEYLQHNTNNRTLKPWLVEKYARDLLEGRWQQHHQGIGFDTNEDLVDGQHRLHAIVLADRAVWMLVTRGLDPLARLTVDDHGRRPMADRLELVGISQASPMAVATLRRMLAGLTIDPREVARISELSVAMRAHGEALAFAEDCFRTVQRGLTVAAVRAVVARAFYSADHLRLRVFVQVLTSGVMTEAGDSAAVLLRNNLLLAPQHGRGAVTQLAIYAKTERALAAFLRREALSKLYEAPHELFPLPEEQAAPRRRQRKPS